jgi:UDP-N-acetylglucosamine 2-epimerase (non-hydrolysing)/GDP/UDP-N,N'-diacetylbacillosamine 2-epimerase (hydrolysing)
MKRNESIYIASGTRADWGLLSPIAKELVRRGASVEVIATNMHLMPEYGDTYKEILADGFVIRHRVPTAGSRAEITAQALSGFSRIFEQESPKAVVILGDRFEMLGVASAALLTGIPIIHIAGGTVSYGAIDDSIRHAISKMATLHLTETEACRERLLAMGEDPDSVVVTGAIGCHNALNMPRIAQPELERDIDFHLGEECRIATLHPTTISPLSPWLQMKNFTDAIGADIAANATRYLITFPNNDVDAAPQLQLLRDLEAANPDCVKVMASLGARRYLSAMAYCGACVGNSSGGLVETPSFGIPTLDIGNRQEGRERAASVIHCGDTTEDIYAGLQRLNEPDIKEIAAKRENPYSRPNTLQIMVDSILSYPFMPYPKKRWNSKKS